MGRAWGSDVEFGEEDGFLPLDTITQDAQCLQNGFYLEPEAKNGLRKRLSDVPQFCEPVIKHSIIKN